MSKPHVFVLLVIVLGFIPFVSLPLAAQEGPAAIEQKLSHAIDLHQAGNLEGAIGEYQAYLAQRPKNVEARSNLGAAYAKLGRYQEAIEQYQQALAVDANNLAVRFNLGIALYKATKIRQAAAELAKVSAGQPDNYNARLLLADCYQRMGEYKKVTELLLPLEAGHRDDRAFNYLLGSALIQDNQLEEGQRIIDRILRDGESAEASLLLGTVQLAARDYAGAKKYLSRAVELNPKLPSMYSFYGRALLETGDQPQALEAFRKELNTNPNDFDANLYLGVLLKQEQKYDEALGYLKHALSLRPGALEVRYQIGALLLSSGELGESQRVLEEIVKDAPQFVEAHVSLATVYYRLKRKEEGDAQRAIVQKLNAEAQARSPVTQETNNSSSEQGTAPKAEAKPGSTQPE